MVRSAERARVFLPVKVRGRVRLVKHVVTEEITQTFTVRREELRVEHVPGDPPETDVSWTYQFPQVDTERDFEIVLHAEQLVVSTAVVPVERVRVRTQVVESGVVVSADLLSEQVVLERDESREQSVGRAVQAQESTEGAAAGGAPTNASENQETP